MFEKIFDKTGLLRMKLNNYECRPQQLIMANRIGEAIRNKEHLIVEAGTGTGKTLSYTIPFIYWAVNEKKRVVISTYTKALQQQLMDNDLPLLKKILDIDVKYALCMGSENYLCLRRFFRAYGDVAGIFESLKEVEEFRQIDEWRKVAKTGLRHEIGFEPTSNIWTKICRESELCLHQRCEYKEECFYNRARKFQNQSQILVVNHHLFFANLMANNMLLPSFDGVVFDEAHNLEDVATTYLGIDVSNTSIRYLLDSFYTPQTQKGLLSRLKIDDAEIIQQIGEVRFAAEQFFLNIHELFGNNAQTKRLRDKNFINNIIKEPILSLISGLSRIKKAVNAEAEQVEVDAFIERVQRVNDSLECIINQSIEDFVYWLETTKKTRYNRIALHANPINVAQRLKDIVFDQTAPVILTSATLTCNKSFDYIKSRLGLNTAAHIALDSPFDYARQSILYVPQHMPDPREDRYIESAAKEIEELLILTHGRAFILFTSYSMLNKLHGIVSKNLPNFNHIKQGDFPPSKAIEMFKALDYSVIWGTSTFWQGVDVPGEALQCVVITRIPFAVPDDPIVEARVESLKQQNIEPFWNYQVPQAIILTKQGYGRLIRHGDDFGVVAILDSRIHTKGYGRLFIQSLPPSKRVSTLSEVTEFMKGR
ncbi:MAG: helicase C-terminal domain-containing protein [bacterium]|nr:helicase C-terminal domain-containing protein [bacterium]